MGTQLSEYFAKGILQQNTNFSDHASNLQKADTALGMLEHKNDVALEDTLHYFLKLRYPDEAEDATTQEELGDVLRRSPCFATNKKRLLVALVELEKNKEGISAVREAFQQMQGKSLNDGARLLQAALVRAAGSGPTARATAGRGSPEFSGKKHPQPKSDITKRPEQKW